MGRPRGPVQSKEEKLLGVDTCREMEALSPEELAALIVEANGAIREAREQLEANPKYQEIKEQAKAVTSAYRELKKRQNGKIEYALKLRESTGN